MTRDEKVFIPDKMEQLQQNDDIYMIADSKILKEYYLFLEKNLLI